MKKKLALTITSIALVAAMAIGGTFAWMTANTSAVTNTFVVGDGIAITLTEPQWDTNIKDIDGYNKMIAGKTITKDPTVTVAADSLKSYVFVKIEEANNTLGENGQYVQYTVADGWTELTGVDDVWYRVADASETAQELPVLEDNQVTFNSAITAMPSVNPELTFTAYAIQYEGQTDANGQPDAATAWANLINDLPADN